MDNLATLAPLLISVALYFLLVVRMRNWQEKGLALLTNDQRGQLVLDLKPVRSWTLYLLLGIVALYFLAMVVFGLDSRFDYFSLFLFLVVGTQWGMGIYTKRVLRQKGYPDSYITLTGKLAWMRLLALGIMAAGVAANVGFAALGLN
jgi:hypothetical protein